MPKKIYNGENLKDLVKADRAFIAQVLELRSGPDFIDPDGDFSPGRTVNTIKGLFGKAAMKIDPPGFYSELRRELLRDIDKAADSDDEDQIIAFYKKWQGKFGPMKVSFVDRIEKHCARVLTYEKERHAPPAVPVPNPAAPISDLQIDSDLIPDVEDGEILGFGTYGVVYKVSYRGRDVAVKQLHANIGIRSSAIRTEFEKLRKLNSTDKYSQFIVKLVGYVEKGQAWKIVMEYIPKGSLRFVFTNEHAHLNWRTHWHPMAKGIAKGLKYSHDKGIPHGDLKPENILIDGNYLPRIADFGITPTHWTGSTYAHSAAYTPVYSASETLLNSPRIMTSRSDVYSLAVIMWEMASGRVPYNGQAAICLLDVAQGGREIIPPTTPQPYAALIARCWGDRTNDPRFQNGAGAPPAVDRPRITEVVEEMKSAAFQAAV